MDEVRVKYGGWSSRCGIVDVERREFESEEAVLFWKGLGQRFESSLTLDCVAQPVHVKDLLIKVLMENRRSQLSMIKLI